MTKVSRKQAYRQASLIVGWWSAVTVQCVGNIPVQSTSYAYFKTDLINCMRTKPMSFKEQKFTLENLFQNSTRSFMKQPHLHV